MKLAILVDLRSSGCGPQHTLIVRQLQEQAVYAALRQLSGTEVAIIANGIALEGVRIGKIVTDPDARTKTTYLQAEIRIACPWDREPEDG